MGKSIIDLKSVTRVGLDLAKRVFRIPRGRRDGLGCHCPLGQSANAFEVFRRASAVRRAMEACASAHHWGRQLLELGFAVRLTAGAREALCPGRNKNDAADAAAICEAAGSAWRSGLLNDDVM